MDVKPGDYVVLTRPAESTHEVWKLRREHPSLVTHVTDDHVHCAEPEAKPDRRVHEWWSATLDDVTVVRRALYLGDELVTCPNCQSTNTHWYVHKVVGPHAPPQPHNKMNLNDVNVVIVRGCVDCSETLETIDAEEWLERLQSC